APRPGCCADEDQAGGQKSDRELHLLSPSAAIAIRSDFRAPITVKPAVAHRSLHFPLRDAAAPTASLSCAVTGLPQSSAFVRPGPRTCGQHIAHGEKKIET